MSDSAPLQSAAVQWTVLRAGKGAAGGLEIPSMPLEATTVAGRIRLAIGPNGEARLLLPLAAQERPAGIEAGRALAATVSSFTLHGRVHRFLDLTCLADELEPVFGEVVEEIVARVARGVGCVEAVRTTLEDFRALIAARAAHAIDISRIAGLVAELVVLNRLLEASPSAWRAWRGPAGDRHDFRAADRSLEVKASLRAASTSLIINGLEQLEAPSGGTLHLAHLVLEPVAAGPLAVGALGSRAFSLADDPQGVRELLMAVGCADVQGPDWNAHAFRVDSEAIYRVEGDFPRIAPSLLRGGTAPAGITDVTYTIDLSHASGHRTSEDALAAIIEALAS